MISSLCVHSVQSPMTITNSPVMSASQASIRCGTMPGKPIDASMPTITMPLVCESVTNMPRINASTGRPRAPTMYAAAMVLP